MILWKQIAQLTLTLGFWIWFPLFPWFNLQCSFWLYFWLYCILYWSVLGLNFCVLFCFWILFIFFPDMQVFWDAALKFASLPLNWREDKLVWELKMVVGWISLGTIHAAEVAQTYRTSPEGDSLHCWPYNTMHVCVTAGQGAQLLLGLLISLEVFVLVGWESLEKFRSAFIFDSLLSRMTTLTGN